MSNVQCTGIIPVAQVLSSCAGPRGRTHFHFVTALEDERSCRL